MKEIVNPKEFHNEDKKSEKRRNADPSEAEEQHDD